ncbi:Hypothetical predicted protein [Cloeon dipterum]|uniref:Uncharacterized protein n=1 Tax=Cloeon dipterum TaxID=197152 RepID=A0A8S1DQU7_9INSE|nr:Hypothetical predicted protein [Cloeon dipterum]
MQECLKISIFILFFATHAKANFIEDIFKIFDSGDPEVERFLDEEEGKSHDRNKRQDVTQTPTVPTKPDFEYTCPSEIYQRLDKCCKVPQLFPTEILNKCTGRNLLNALPKRPVRNFKPVQLSRHRKNYFESFQKNSTIKTRTEDICKVHCIFKLQRWLAPENYVDENLLYASLAIIIPPGPFQNLISSNYVRTECTGISTHGDYLSIATNMSRQRCMIAPFRMLRCIKRSMLLAYNNCSGIAQNLQCDLDKANLRKCDVFSV